MLLLLLLLPISKPEPGIGHAPSPSPTPEPTSPTTLHVLEKDLKMEDASSPRLSESLLPLLRSPTTAVEGMLACVVMAMVAVSSVALATMGVVDKEEG